MHLFELFQNESGDVTARLRQAAMDLLTPMAAQKVPFVTMQQVVDQLRHERSGLVVDRALIMNLLEPGEVGLVKKIEGDRIYLAAPEGEERATDPDDGEREKAKISHKATQQAKKEVTK